MKARGQQLPLDVDAFTEAYTRMETSDPIAYLAAAAEELAAAADEYCTRGRDGD